jgi:hypothetical protein
MATGIPAITPPLNTADNSFLGQEVIIFTKARHFSVSIFSFESWNASYPLLLVICMICVTAFGIFVIVFHDGVYISACL